MILEYTYYWELCSFMGFDDCLNFINFNYLIQQCTLLIKVNVLIKSFCRLIIFLIGNKCIIPICFPIDVLLKNNFVIKFR